jgi:hypothetical protein
MTATLAIVAAVLIPFAIGTAIGRWHARRGRRVLDEMIGESHGDIAQLRDDLGPDAPPCLTCKAQSGEGCCTCPRTWDGDCPSCARRRLAEERARHA